MNALHDGDQSPPPPPSKEFTRTATRDGAVVNPTYGSAAADVREVGAVVTPTYGDAGATATTAAAAPAATPNTLYSIPMDTVAAGNDHRARSAGGGAVVVEAVQTGSSQPQGQVSAAGNDERSSSMSWRMVVDSNSKTGGAPSMAHHSNVPTTGGLWAWVKAHRLLTLVAVLLTAIAVLAAVAATSNGSSSAVNVEPAAPMMPYPKEMEIAPQGFVPFAMRSRETRDAMVGLRKTHQALAALRNGDVAGAQSAVGRDDGGAGTGNGTSSDNPIDFIENGGLDALILPDDPAEAGAVYYHNFTTILATNEMPEFGAFCFDCSCYLARYPDELAVLLLGGSAGCNDKEVSTAMLNHYEQVGASERQNPCCCEVETIPKRQRKAAQSDLDVPVPTSLSLLREDMASDYYAESRLDRERRQGCPGGGCGPDGPPSPPPPPPDLCTPNQCGYGSCKTYLGGKESNPFTFCTCYAGSTGGGGGRACQNPPNWCAGVSCGPGGSCSSGATAYTCSCAAGSSGGGVNTPCVDVNECSGITCGGASSTCVNGNNKYS